jgi:hypothetical protein
MSLLLLAPSLLGQTVRVATAPELSVSASPHLTLPDLALPDPTPSPVVNLRHHLPIAPSGQIGFPSIARAAGAIFSGTVTAVARRPPSGGQSVETVVITFHVESAIRGATPGEDLTIAQWIGLWSGGQRYRIGERVLLFLYPPSKLGLTSCVAGGIGRFGIDPQGRVLLTAQHLSSFRTDPVLGGKARVLVSDFARAVQRAHEEN